MGTTISSQSKSLGVLAITNADKDLYEVNGRTLVSARLGVEAPDGRWAVFGWGRNIFNKYYLTTRSRLTIQLFATLVDPPNMACPDRHRTRLNSSNNCAHR